MATTTTTTTTTTDLATLVVQIKRELALLYGTQRAGLKHARNAGEFLNTAKDQVEHGQWGAWLKDNFKLTHGTANVWMKVAKNWDMFTPEEREQFTIRQFLKGCQVKYGAEEVSEDNTQATTTPTASTTTNESAAETPVAQPASMPAPKTAVTLFDPPAARERDRVMDMARELGVDPVFLKAALVKHGFLNESLAA